MWEDGDRAGAAKMSQGERLLDTREGPGEMAEMKWKCQRGFRGHRSDELRGSGGRCTVNITGEMGGGDSVVLGVFAIQRTLLCSEDWTKWTVEMEGNGDVMGLRRRKPTETRIWKLPA